MMPSLDELASAWQQEPTASLTVSLCALLGGAGTEALMETVGGWALAEHGDDVELLLAVGRMYARGGRLADAQIALALAGKADGRDPRPFEDLGHVLLLRGDAVRARQALHRALGLGGTHAAVPEWLEAASEFGDLQRTRGEAAVTAAIVARGLEWDDATTLRVAPAPAGAGAPPSSAGANGSEDGVGQPPEPGQGDERHPLTRLGCGADPAAPLRWERVARPRTAGVRVLLVATVTSAVVLVGAGLFATQVRASRVSRAAARAESLRLGLSTAPGDGARERSRELVQLFALDGGGAAVAAAWLEERVLGVLWAEEPPAGLWDAVARAQAAELPASRIAAGRIAARLSVDDVEGALELIGESGISGADDALYALMAGAALERRGDPRALERYLESTELEPTSIPARVLLVRLSLLERGTEASRRQLARLETELGDDLVVRALRRLAWAVDPERQGSSPPPRLTDEEGARLPRPLRFVRAYADAVLAADRGERATVAEQVATGLGVVSGPAELVAFGHVAARAGREGLARQAAVRVDAVAPDYRGLPALAARIALLRGRYADAVRATTVGAVPREVALVYGVEAYERLDPAGVTASLVALPESQVPDLEVSALRLAPAALAGTSPPEPEAVYDLGSTRVLWGDLVGVDCAIDAGRIDLARTLVRSWDGQAEERAPQAVRLARLARLAGKLELAVDYARRAMATGDSTPRAVIELVRALAEAGEGSAARRCLEDGAAQLTPALRTWLDVLVTRAESGPRAGLLRATRSELPPVVAPLTVRALAVRALVEVGDRRALAAFERLAQVHSEHPDVARSRTLLGRD